MSSNLLNQKTFSDFAGVSKAAISKAVKEGRLILTENKKIDPSCKTTQLYLMNLNSKRHIQKKRKDEGRKRNEKKHIEDKKIVTSTGKKSEKKTTKSVGSVIYDNEEILSKPIAEIKRINAQTAKIKLSMAREMKVLVMKDDVDKLFKRLHSVIYSFFFPVGDRISSTIIDLCDVTDNEIKIKIKNIIDNEIMRGLNQFKEESKKEI